MPGISVSKIPIPFRGAGGINWSSYWATHIYNQDDLNFRFTNRSGLTLADTVGANNVSILVPTAKLNGTNNCMTCVEYVTGGVAWDFIIRFKLVNTNDLNPLVTCGGYGANLKGLCMVGTTGDIEIYTSNGANTTTAAFNFNLSNNTWYSCRLQWSGVTGEAISLTIGGTTLTSTTNYGWVGASQQVLNFGQYAGFAYAEGCISSVVGSLGSLNMMLYPNGLSTFEYNISDTILPSRVTWEGTTGYCSYEDAGDTYYLDHGWTIYKNALNVYQYVPHNSFGKQVGVLINLSGTYKEYADGDGSITKHNLWKSKLRFTNMFFDRSDVAIWNNDARVSYDAANPLDFTIEELNYKTLRSWLNDGYAGRLYLRFTDTSIDFRTSCDEIYLYSTDKKGDDNRNCLAYSQDIRQAQKDSSGVYILDANGYVEIYDYNDLGVEADATANYTAYQALINAGDAVIGSSKYDVFKISQPLLVPSGRTLTVNCELKIKNATIVNLTADVGIGDTIINVDSVVGFELGQIVAISNDLLPVQGGTGTQTRRESSSGKIINIGATTITIDRPSTYAITFADNGKLGHCQTVILMESKTNCTVRGSGVINGNWQNLYDVEPVSGGMADSRGSCGIAALKSNNIKVGGDSANILTLRNAGQHNICVWGTGDQSSGNDCAISYVLSEDAHDKNILFNATKRIHIHHITTRYALFEDGLIGYMENYDYNIHDITCYGNGRSGLTLNATLNTNGIVSDIDSSDEIYLRADKLVVSNIKLHGHLAKLNISDNSGVITDIVINNLEFERASAFGHGILEIVGEVSGVIINELEINDCNMGLYSAIVVDDNAGNGHFPTVAIDGGGFYNFTGVKSNIDVNATVTFNDFDNYP